MPRGCRKTILTIRTIDQIVKSEHYEVFETEILNKLDLVFEETVMTRVHFEGYINNGFFDNQIILLIGRVVWNLDPKTLKNCHPSTPGNLMGNIDYESQWSWTIPKNYPTGKYTFFTRVYDHIAPSNRIVIAEHKYTIVVQHV